MIYFVAFVLALSGADLVDKGQYQWGASLLAGAAVAALVAMYVDRKYPE